MNRAPPPPSSELGKAEAALLGVVSESLASTEHQTPLPVLIDVMDKVRQELGGWGWGLDQS